MANGKRIIPKAGETDLVEEQHTAQAKLRSAVFGAIGEHDVEEVVKGIVERAKSGDAVAMKYLFEYILGGRVTTAVQNNYYVDGTSPPDQPTDARPGSRQKLDVMQHRVLNGQGVFHGRDS